MENYVLTYLQFESVSSPGNMAALVYVQTEAPGKIIVTVVAYICRTREASGKIIVTKCYMQNLSEYSDSANFKISLFICCLRRQEATCLILKLQE